MKMAGSNPGHFFELLVLTRFLHARCCEAKRLHPDEALTKTGRRVDG